jgi:hypothetical protein
MNVACTSRIIARNVPKPALFVPKLVMNTISLLPRIKRHKKYPKNKAASIEAALFLVVIISVYQL